jgi:hypothetical protein
MMQKADIRSLPLLLLVGVLFLFACSCEKKNPSPAQEVIPSTDRVAPSPANSNQTVLRETFSISTSASFPFEIPPHTAMPHLHGNYKSFVKQLGAQANDDGGNVDFLILTADQYADFTHGRAVESLFSADSSHDQDVSVSLPITQDQPRRYYLIFRNPPGDKTKKLVQAEFTLDF